MNDLWTKFLQQVQRQGFSVMLLMLVAYHFQTQNDQLQQKVDDCNATQVAYYEKQLDYLKTVIQDNTRALDQNSEALQKIQQK